MRPDAPTAAAPLRVILVNLMPLKQSTERQFARLLLNRRHDVELVLVTPPGHVCHHTSSDHIGSRYTPWHEAAARPADGVIVTGAPVELLEFDQVDYWPWFREMCDWAACNARHSLFICWAAQAALNLRHGIGKRALPMKAFGLYRQTVLDRRHPLMRGLGEELVTPVSRHTEIATAEVARRRELSIVAASSATGLAIVEDRAHRATCMFNHIEYEARTLHDEYVRDRAAGRATGLPHDYYRHGIMTPPASASWAEDAARLFANWLDLLAEGQALPLAA